MRFAHVLGALLLGGCDPQPGDVDADGLVDCRDVDGTFRSDVLTLTSADEALVEAFDDLTIEFSWPDDLFTTTLREDGALRSTSGDYFGEDADTLVITGPLVPGMAARVTPLDCAYVFPPGELRLLGPVGYDFADDGVDGPVEATLDALLVRP